MIKRGSVLSRVLALLIVLGPIVFAGAAFGVWSVRNWSKSSALLERAERQEREFAARNVQARAYESLLQRWREYVSSAGSGLARPASDAAAAQDVIERAKALLEEFEGELLQGVAGKSSTVEGLRRATVDLSATLPEAALDKFFQKLETEPPYLFIDFLAIRQAPSAEAPGVKLHLKLSSLRLVEAPQ